MKRFHRLTTPSGIFEREFPQQLMFLISHQGGLHEIAVDERQLRLVHLGCFPKGAVEIAERPIHVTGKEHQVFAGTQLSRGHGVGVGTHVGFYGRFDDVMGPSAEETLDGLVMSVGTLVKTSRATFFHDAKVLGDGHVESKHGGRHVTVRGLYLHVLVQGVERHEHHLVVVGIQPVVIGPGILKEFLTLKMFAVVHDARPEFRSRHAVQRIAKYVSHRDAAIYQIRNVTRI